MAAVVSTGAGDVPFSFSAVERVVGTIDEAPVQWFEARPPIHGRYGARHMFDVFGFGRNSYDDF